jgi:hypothetical protein
MAAAGRLDCPLAGRFPNALFTIGRLARYRFGMVILAAAVLAATLEPQASAPTTPGRQAQAMVTILPAVPLHFSAIERDHPEQLRETSVRTPGGAPEIVRLVEFE